MKKNIREIVVFFIVIIFGTTLIGKRLHPNYADNCYNNIVAFHKLTSNSVDLVVYGSSHAWRGCNTKYISDKYGIVAYNYSANWQRINSTYMYMQDSFRTQKPKVALVECYKVSVISEDEDMTGETYYSKAVPWFDGKREYLKRVFGDNKERWLSYFFPFIMFHSGWVDVFDEEQVRDENRSVQFYLDSLGYDSSTQICGAALSPWETFEQKDLEAKYISELQRIVDICNENNTKVVFFTVPYEGMFPYHDFLQNFADENGCVYIDCFENIEEIGIDSETDFRDPTHLNTNGANKIADYLMNCEEIHSLFYELKKDNIRNE